MVKLYELLKNRRAELKLTQEEAAKKIGTSYSNYTAWEHGKNNGGSSRVAIARFLGITAEQLEELLKCPK